MSEPRVRVVEGGVEIDVPNDHPRGALVLESAPGSYVRIALDGETRAWARVLPAMSGIAWARAEGPMLDVIPHIRASEARSIDDWPAWMARVLARSERTWLRPGLWGLSTLGSGAYGENGAPPSARDLSLALDRPARFVGHYTAVSRIVLPLRAASMSDHARVKSWRKHARDGTLPPILLGWVGALDAYVVLDGHDRLLAARCEGIVPEAIGLFAIHERHHRWGSEVRERAREVSLARYARIFESEPRLGASTRVRANRDLVSAWSDHHERYAGTIARRAPDLPARFRTELASCSLDEDVRAALLR